MATLAAPIHDEAEWRSPHVVKVVVGADGRALYFSRSPIPYDRDGERAGGRAARAGVTSACTRYRRDVLLRLAALPPSPLERREQLEQLRALEHGIAIGVVAWTAAEPVIEVDTPADLEQARAGGDGWAGMTARTTDRRPSSSS